MHFVFKRVVKRYKNNHLDKVRSFQRKPVTELEIELEQLVLSNSNKCMIVMERPVVVRGVIAPIETKGRKPAPDPISFKSLGKYLKRVSKKRFSWLAEDCDRGHIFALELGGCNEDTNIIPQWKGFQEHGDWRRLERLFKTLSSTLLKKGNSLFLEIEIEYLNLNLHHLQSRLIKLFSFKNKEDYSEDKIKKCLQIFGTPTSYLYDTYPCNVFVRKPKDHSLSIPYIQYLYEVNALMAKDSRKISFKLKNESAQKELAKKGWGVRTLMKRDLIQKDEQLISHLEDYCLQGTIALSAITEEDLKDL